MKSCWFRLRIRHIEKRFSGAITFKRECGWTKQRFWQRGEIIPVPGDAAFRLEDLWFTAFPFGNQADMDIVFWSKRDNVCQKLKTDILYFQSTFLANLTARAIDKRFKVFKMSTGSAEFPSAMRVFPCAQKNLAKIMKRKTDQLELLAGPSTHRVVVRRLQRTGLCGCVGRRVDGRFAREDVLR